MESDRAPVWPDALAQCRTEAALESSPRARFARRRLFRQHRMEERLRRRQRILGSRRGALAHGRLSHFGTQIERARDGNFGGWGWAVRVAGLGIRRPHLRRRTARRTLTKGLAGRRTRDHDRRRQGPKRGRSGGHGRICDLRCLWSAGRFRGTRRGFAVGTQALDRGARQIVGVAPFFRRGRRLDRGGWRCRRNRSR
jgi:hypothetical protein